MNKSTGRFSDDSIMIQSIARAFDILKVVSDFPEGISTGAIAQMTDLHPSTVSRIVSSLEELNALERAEGTKVVIGKSISNMIDQTPWTERLVRLAEPIMQDLARETGEAVGLTRITDGICEIFYQIQSDHLVGVKDWQGLSFPIHVTSTGKLYLASLKKEELNSYLKTPLVKLASNSVHKASILKKEIKDLRNNKDNSKDKRFIWTIDELEDGLASIAASILDKSGSFQAGLYLSLPTYRLTNDLRSRLEYLIPTATQEISERISNTRLTDVPEQEGVI